MLMGWLFDITAFKRVIEFPYLQEGICLISAYSKKLAEYSLALRTILLPSGYLKSYTIFNN